MQQKTEEKLMIITLKGQIMGLQTFFAALFFGLFTF